MRIVRAPGRRFSARGLVDPSGLMDRAAESLPVRSTSKSRSGVFRSQPPSGVRGPDRPGLVWLGLVAGDSRQLATLVPPDSRYLAKRTIGPSGPLGRVVGAIPTRSQNGSEPMWDVTALGRS
jgi:hypothetical protein